MINERFQTAVEKCIHCSADIRRTWIQTIEGKLCCDACLEAYRLKAEYDSLPDKILHEFYRNGDLDIPESILDNNGEVVLALCKNCGKAEVQLEDTYCTGHNKPQMTVNEIRTAVVGEREFIDGVHEAVSGLTRAIAEFEDMEVCADHNKKVTGNFAGLNNGLRDFARGAIDDRAALRVRCLARATDIIRTLTSHGVLFRVQYEAHSIHFAFVGYVHVSTARTILTDVNFMPSNRDNEASIVLQW